MSCCNRLNPSKPMIIPCPHDMAIGMAYYLKSAGHFDMSSAILLSFDCHFQLNELQSLANQTVVLDQSPSQLLHLILHCTKRGANHSVDVRYKMIRELQQRHVFKFRNTSKKRLFPFSEDTWSRKIWEVI